MKSNTTRSIDFKILEILSNGEFDYSSLKEKLDIPSSSLSTSLSKLKEDEFVEEFDQKKYRLIQNEELEEIILKQCPFDDVNELLKKIKESKQQKTSKFAQDKKLLEFTLKKLEKLHLIEKSADYELSKDGCAKIQFCVECKTPVLDGVTPIVLMDFDTMASYHYPIHPKCYSNWEGEHGGGYHNENYCDFCGLALEYGVLLNKYSDFNWVLTLLSFLDLNEKKHLENAINIQVLSELSLICKYKVAPNDVIPLSAGLSAKKFNYEKSWNISVKLKPEYVNGLLDKFGSLDVSIFSEKNLGGNKEIKSKKELDFKNENSTKLKFTNELWGKTFTFSNFEEFFVFIEKNDNYKVSKDRIKELYAVLSDFETKKVDEAREVVQRLYDPISLITQTMTPPDYRDEYLKHIDEFVHKPTGMSWVVKKQGKTYHPYCSKKIEG